MHITALSTGFVQLISATAFVVICIVFSPSCRVRHKQCRESPTLWQTRTVVNDWHLGSRAEGPKDLHTRQGEPPQPVPIRPSCDRTGHCLSDHCGEGAFTLSHGLRDKQAATPLSIQNKQTSHYLTHTHTYTHTYIHNIHTHTHTYTHTSYIYFHD